MKKLFCITLVLASFFASAQILPIDKETNKITFTQVVELDQSYKADKIMSSVKEWLSSNPKSFNRSNSDKNFTTGTMLGTSQKGNSAQLDQLYRIETPLKVYEAEEKKAIGASVLKYTSDKSIGCVRIVYLTYSIRVVAKDGKYKIELSNFNYTHYNQVSMKESQFYGMKDQGPCMSKNTLENLLQCDHCSNEFEKFYTYIKDDMTKQMDELKTFIATSKGKDDF